MSFGALQKASQKKCWDPFNVDDRCLLGQAPLPSNSTFHCSSHLLTYKSQKAWGPHGGGVGLLKHQCTRCRTAWQAKDTASGMLQCKLLCAGALGEVWGGDRCGGALLGSPRSRQGSAGVRALPCAKEVGKLPGSGQAEEGTQTFTGRWRSTEQSLCWMCKAAGKLK